MNVRQLIAICVVVCIMFTLATIISNNLEQYTAIAYFVGGVISQTIVLSISRDA